MLGDPAPPRSSSPASGDLPQNFLCIVFQETVQRVDLLIISLLHIWIQPGCGTDVVEDCGLLSLGFLSQTKTLLMDQ